MLKLKNENEKQMLKIITKPLRNKNKPQIFFRRRKLAQSIHFNPYFCLPDTFLAEKLHLGAFAASRKISHKFSQVSRFQHKIQLGGLAGTDRHHALNDLIADGFVSASFLVTKALTDLFPSDGKKRPESHKARSLRLHYFRQFRNYIAT